MTYKIIITSSAFSDLESIKLFIAKDNLEIAKKYILKIFDRFEQLETFPYSGFKIANSIFDYAKAYCLICANHVAIYQVDELKKCVYILRVLSHYQDWENIVNKDILCNKQIITENDSLQIVKMNQSMYCDIYKNSQDDNNHKFAPDEVFNSLEETSDVVNQIINSYDSKDGPFVYAVIRKKDNINLGYVQLVKIEEGWEIGYHIAEIYNGNGYATEAVNLFLDHIKNNTNLKQIIGIALASNKASRRVLEKCGFELIYEGAGIYQGRKRKIIKAIKHL
ncbi:MAG: GNAT family N-acetyltransferase [Bacilli bacterium]|nr:GNAT family N-acetyltransferase [Bacilli bacterium]